MIIMNSETIIRANDWCDLHWKPSSEQANNRAARKISTHTKNNTQCEEKISYFESNKTDNNFFWALGRKDEKYTMKSSAVWKQLTSIFLLCFGPRERKKNLKRFCRAIRTQN